MGKKSKISRQNKNLFISISQVCKDEYSSLILKRYLENYGYWKHINISHYPLFGDLPREKWPPLPRYALNINKTQFYNLLQNLKKVGNFQPLSCIKSDTGLIILK